MREGEGEKEKGEREKGRKRGRDRGREGEGEVSPPTRQGEATGAHSEKVARPHGRLSPELGHVGFDFGLLTSRIMRKYISVV